MSQRHELEKKPFPWEIARRLKWTKICGAEYETTDWRIQGINEQNNTYHIREGEITFIHTCSLITGIISFSLKWLADVFYGRYLHPISSLSVSVSWTHEVKSEWVTSTFLFISADSNVTVINTALMNSPRALSFHWTPRVPVSARSAKSLRLFGRLRHESLKSRCPPCCCILNMSGGFPLTSSGRYSLKWIRC